MVTKISAHDLERLLSDVLSRVHDDDERFIVERDGTSMAAIIPAEPTVRITLAELLDRLEASVPIGGGFADDLEEITHQQTPAGDPACPN